MRIPYYSPHIYLSDIFFALFQKNSRNKTIEYFREYTGKKYVLLTSSCRASIYLALKAINETGIILSSPLTCRSAIDPISWAGHKIRFVDIDVNTLNISLSDLLESVDTHTKAIQIINHGGIPFDTKELRNKLGKKKVFVIEDCAQSFLSTIHERPSGFFSDLACYSLIKNAYGIGGGILATNNDFLYKRAKSIQNNFQNISLSKLIYRVLRNLIETQRRVKFFDKLFIVLNKIRFFNKDDSRALPTKHLIRPHSFFFKVFIRQTKKIKSYSKIRNKLGSILFEHLSNAGLMENYHEIDLRSSSFTKFFVYNRKIKPYALIEKLKQLGIDAKHLENRHDSRLQLMDEAFGELESSGLDNCVKAKQVSEHLISLPLVETFSKDDIEHIINSLRESINHE